MTTEEYMKEHPDATFIAMVESEGRRRYFTDKNRYLQYRDEVWDSGKAFEAKVIKGTIYK